MKKIKKYDWGIALDNLKKLVAKKVPMVFPNNKGYATHAIDYLFETDQFHPMNNESEFEKSLQDNDWEFLEQSLILCFCEIIQKIVDYYSEPWNFGPGYKIPKMLESFEDEWWDKLRCKHSDFLKFKKETLKIERN
jgi:hypothetical protein